MKTVNHYIGNIIISKIVISGFQCCNEQRGGAAGLEMNKIIHMQGTLFFWPSWSTAYYVSFLFQSKKTSETVESGDEGVGEDEEDEDEDEEKEEVSAVMGI